MKKFFSIKILVLGLILSSLFVQVFCCKAHLFDKHPAHSNAELRDRAKRGLVLLVPYHKDGTPLASDENPLENPEKKKIVEPRLNRSKRDPSELSKIFLRHNDMLKDSTDNPKILSDEDKNEETKHFIRVKPASEQKDTVENPFDIRKAQINKRNSGFGSFQPIIFTNNVNTLRNQKNARKYTCYCKEADCKEKQCVLNQSYNGIQNTKRFPNVKEYVQDDSEEDTAAEDTDDDDYPNDNNINRLTPAPLRYNIPVNAQPPANQPKHSHPMNYAPFPKNHFDPSKVDHLGIFTPNIVIPGQYLPVVSRKNQPNMKDCIKLYGHTICAISSTARPPIKNVEANYLPPNGHQNPKNNFDLNPPYQRYQQPTYQSQHNLNCPNPSHYSNNPGYPPPQPSANVNVIIGNPHAIHYPENQKSENSGMLSSTQDLNPNNENSVPDPVSPTYETTYKNAGLSDIATASSNVYSSIIPTMIYPKEDQNPSSQNSYESNKSTSVSDYATQYTTLKPQDYTQPDDSYTTIEFYNSEAKNTYPSENQLKDDTYDPNKAEKSSTTRAAKNDDEYSTTPEMLVPLSSTNKNYNEVILTSSDIYGSPDGPTTPTYAAENASQSSPVYSYETSPQSVDQKPEYTLDNQTKNPEIKASSLPNDKNYLNPEHTNDDALVKNVVKIVINNFVPGKSQDLIANFANHNYPDLADSVQESLLPEIQNATTLKNLLKIPEVKSMIVDTSSELVSEISETPITDKMRKKIEDTLEEIIAKEMPQAYSTTAATTVQVDYNTGNQWVTQRANALEKAAGVPPPEVFEKIKDIIEQSGLEEESMSDPMVQNMIVKAVKHALDKERGAIDESTIRRAFKLLVPSRASSKTKRASPPRRGPVSLSNLYGRPYENGPMDYYYPEMYDPMMDDYANNDYVMPPDMMGDTGRYHQPRPTYPPHTGPGPLASPRLISRDTMGDLGRYHQPTRIKLASNGPGPSESQPSNLQDMMGNLGRYHQPTHTKLDNNGPGPSESQPSNLQDMMGDLGRYHQPTRTKPASNGPGPLVSPQSNSRDSMSNTGMYQKPLRTYLPNNAPGPSASQSSNSKDMWNELGRYHQPINNAPGPSTSPPPAASKKLIIEPIQGDQIYLLVELTSSDSLSDQSYYAYNTASATSDTPTSPVPVGRLIPANITDLRTSKLVYVANGVSLPLAVRRLEDGSSVITLSDQTCKQFSDKRCPCCIPVHTNGMIVRESKIKDQTDYPDEKLEDVYEESNNDLGSKRIRRESTEDFDESEQQKIIQKRRSHGVGRRIKTFVSNSRPSFHMLFSRGPPYRYQRYADEDPWVNFRTTTLKNILYWIKDLVTNFPLKK